MNKFIEFLYSLLYKTITVYIASYENIKFSGVLYDINENFIFIVLKIPNNKHSKTKINFNKKYSNSKIIIHNNQIVQIPINQIDSIIYFPTTEMFQ